MTKLAQALAEQMKRLRGSKSQRAFAVELGIEQATLSRIESGTENVTLRTLERICSALHCEVGALFRQEPVGKPGKIQPERRSSRKRPERAPKRAPTTTGREEAE